MKDLLKEEAKSIKENLIRLSAEIDSLGRTLTKTQGELEFLSQKIKDDSKDKISDLEDRIKKFTSLLEIHNKKAGEFASVESEISSQYRKNYGLLTESKGALKAIVEKIKFYENDKCPTCTSDLAGAYHEGIKDELNKKLDEFKEQVNEYQDLHNQILGKETEIKTQKADLNSKGNKITVNINSAKDELRKIKSNITSSDALDSLRKISEDTRENVQKNTEDRSKEEKKSEWLKKIEDVLGDKGIKQLALKSILPSLNSHIADLMISLHLPYTVRFDEDFNASIIHMGEEISISTLSTGEMKKVDFAVLLSVLKLMKIRFSSINLLFLDEIFSSIDPDGVYTILTTLRKICDDLGLNVFVINHAPMPTEIFDYKIDIQKRNNFSDIQIDKV
jgi:DNA repair exonuclease SbcCD ATPase subunit